LNCLIAGCSVLTMLLGGGAIAVRGQTAHFNGAQPAVVFGGTGILGIAIDAKGDEYVTVQNNFLAARNQRAVGYVPAALHSPRAKHPWDAQKRDISGCSYQGPGSFMEFVPANSNADIIETPFVAPTGIALDSSGDLYVLDEYTATIYELYAVNGSVPVNGSLAYRAVVTGVSCNGGDLAVDAQGDLYFTTGAGNTVNEILAVNGVIPSSPKVISLGSGFDLPLGIAVDGSGNVYVADVLNNMVKELVAVNGSVPPSPTILTLGSGFDEPAAVTVDGFGNVYVSDYQNNALKEILAVNGSIPSSPTIKVLGSFNAIGAVTLDGKGDIYVGDAGTNGGTVTEVIPSGANFGQDNVGLTESIIPMAFSFDTAGTLGGISVLTDGASGLDFTAASTGTCKATTAYSTGQSCTVNVNFTPEFSGTRNGAVVLTATNGNVIATGYVTGTGIAPQVNFSPDAESILIGTGLDNPTGVALDGSGNVYVADANGLEKATPSGGAFTVSKTTASATTPFGVAVDGAGNVYIGDNGGSRVLKETPTTTGYAETVIASGFTPMGIAVDGTGNVYVADQENARIVKETQANGVYTQSVVVGGLTTPYGVAVDGSGNLYIADAGVSGLLKETLTAGSFVQSIVPVSGQVSPESVVVDGTGNLYFMDAQTENVFKETLASNNYVESAIISDLHQGSGIAGLAVDAVGNVYVAYTGNQSVEKGDFADAPSLGFASTTVGTTSADSPRIITLANNGNAPLNLPVPASGNDPSIGANFTLSGSDSSDCPVIGSGAGSPGTLAVGSSCELAVSFAPTVAGTDTGALVLTDNNLNTSSPNYATQSIQLSGIGLPAKPSVSWPTPAAITFGTALSGTQLNATASVPGIFTYSPAAGAILTVGQQTLTVTFTPTDTTDYTSATASVTLTVNQAAPSITSALTANGTAGSSFSYQITASNSPTSYGATGLPAGLSVNASTGLISGTPTAAGTSTVTLSATNSTGTGTATLTLTIAPIVSAAISFVQVSAKAASATSNSLVLSFPANTLPGDLILVAFDFASGVTPSAVTDSQGNTFTAVGNQLTSPGGTASRVYYAKNITGGADTVTIKLSASSEWIEAYLTEYSGANTVSPVDAQAGASGSSSTVSSGKATTTAAGDLIYGYCVGDWACTAGAGFAARSTFNNNLIEDMTTVTTGSYAATGSATYGWAMQMVALKR
jgi:streptogramin lyase